MFRLIRQLRIYWNLIFCIEFQKFFLFIIRSNFFGCFDPRSEHEVSIRRQDPLQVVQEIEEGWRVSQKFGSIFVAERFHRTFVDDCRLVDQKLPSHVNQIEPDKILLFCYRSIKIILAVFCSTLLKWQNLYVWFNRFQAVFEK